MEKKTIVERISNWWRGKFKTYDVTGVVGFYTERHWTSNAAHAVWEFYLKHWQ